MFVHTPNTMKAALRERRTIYGLYLSFPSPELIEFAGTVKGIDYIHLDGEHGVFDMRDVETCVRAADLMGLPTLARTPDSTAETIQRYLDRGVRGIVAPHISTVADAERVANACRYAPQGTRSFGGARGNRYGYFEGDQATHMKELNDDRVVSALIEDVEAVNNLDAMLRVEGIDTWTIGPNDLAQSMGYPGQTHHPAVKQAIADINRRIEAAGKPIRDKHLVSIRDKAALREGLQRTMGAG